MATITLTEVNATLGEIRDGQKETTNAVTSLAEKISAQMEAAEMNRLRELNQRRSGAGGVRTPSSPAAGGPGAGSSNLGGRAAGLGLGLAALGAGAMKGAAGLTAMGLAIPAFFGGLLAGSEGLGWLQDVAGMDYDGLKKAALGFSDIILEMDPKAFVVLGGIMGISAIAKPGAAKSLASMGLAISGFLGGLMAGSTLLEGAYKVADVFGGTIDFGGMKKAMVGFSDMIMGVDQKALTIMAGLLGLGAIAGIVSKNPLDAAKGMAGLAAGIIGFLGGLVIGNDILSFAEILGADLDLAALGKTLGGFSEAVGQLKPEAAIALAGIITGSVGLAKFGADAKTAKNTVAMMTGVGAGISGLMIGLSAGDAAISWIDKIKAADSAGLVGAFKLFNDSIGELKDKNAIIALTAIVGAGSALGALLGAKSVTAAGGIFAIMSGIGAGIAGLMVGLSAGDFIISYLQQYKGEGEGIVGVFRTFNDSILAITPEAIERIKSLADIGGLDLVKILGGLTAGIVAFLGAEGFSSALDKLGDAFFGSIDKIFGTDLKDKKNPGIVQQMVDGLKPLEDFDVKKVNDFSSAINRLSTSFAGLADIDVGGSTSNLGKLLKNVGGIIDAFPYLLNGGTWSGQKIGFGDNIRFGPAGEGGIANIKPEDIELVGAGVRQLRKAILGIEGDPAGTSGPTANGAYQLGEISVQAPRDVSIVRMSDEVLNALTAVLMQKDYGERVSASRAGAGTYVNAPQTTTVNNSQSQGIVLPMAQAVDTLDGGLALGGNNGPF